MKSFKQLIAEVAEPKSKDEIDFKAKHEIEMIDHPESEEHQHTAEKKGRKRLADYAKGEDMTVYEKKMDPVDHKALKGDFEDREDKDIDNDGEVDDSDRYLHNRRKAISKAMKESDDVVFESMNSKQKAAIEQYMKTIQGKNIPKDLVKISVDALMHALKESEDLSEISKKTLGSYIRKASDDMAGTAYQLGARDPLKPKASWSKAFKRGKGIAKATDRLTKEEVDLDESTMPSNVADRLADRHAAAAIYHKKNGNMKGYSVHSKISNDIIDAMVRVGGNSPIKSKRLEAASDKAFLAHPYKSVKTESTDLAENFKQGSITLNDGSKVVVSKQNADLLNQMFDDLNARNKKEMMKVAMTDKDGFNEILGFAREAL